jgi:hypothetical protein
MNEWKITEQKVRLHLKRIECIGELGVTLKTTPGFSNLAQ